MSAIARDWLPSGAFTRDAVRGALGACLDGWADIWFGDVRAEIAGVSFEGIARDGSLGSATRYAHDALDAMLSAPGKRAIIEAALHTPLGERDLNARDHTLLDAFTGALVRDLLERLGASIPRAQPDETAARTGLTIVLHGVTILEVSIEAHRLVPRIRQAARPALRSRAKPASRWLALGGTTTTIEATLGRACLSIDEIEGFATGDVIVLDALVEDGVALSVAGVPMTRALPRLDRDDAHVTLQF